MLRISSFIILISLFIYSCANQSSPTGGPKDEDPPKLVSSDPAQGEINFKGDKVILEFDEFVKTNNPKEQILITPRIEQDYTFKYKKNRVIITFKEPLKDSTTYSINFREGIKDITEGNAPENLILAFSTGPYLDSMSIAGSVNYLVTNKLAEDVTVSLYDSEDTLDVFNSPPIYLTKTDTEGKYQFQNLKVGNYKIYAISDKNKNLILDSKTEAYGFRSSILPLDTNLVDIDIPMITMDVRPFEYQSSRQSGTTFNIKFNKYIDNYSISRTDSSKVIFSNITRDDPNTIKVYNNIPEDSVQVILQATDTTGTTIAEQLYVKFEQSSRKPSAFESKGEIKPVLSTVPKLDVLFNFNKPVQYSNKDSIYLFLDSANIVFMADENFTWNTNRTELQVQYDIDPSLFVREDNRKITASERYNKAAKKPEPTDTAAQAKPKQPDPKPFFYASKGSFISIEGDSSKQYERNLSFNKPDQLATLLISIQTEKESFFVQLVNNKNEVIAERANEKEFKFTHIKPGDYKLRVLIDSNNNGIWELGNIMTNDEPEPIVFYKSSEGNETVTLRANWEVGPTVISF
ncbi:Ig-like domain-containing protein [Fulvivirga ligni]|uniref:Ig-like domain-containing protein n=1 Tax=Fulvivirga ligni TaxID=2904246 RepID=UPI001F1590CC|nr:Ig-like domain-containing protein [Fulvivirga ligni]UII22339.1 Ig-like domain-containing protein [Fulvivirga ligni]